MVPESTIEEVMTEYEESEEAFETQLERWQAEAPVLVGYLFNENMEAFTEDEQEYLLFLTTIIYTAAARHYGDRLPEIREGELAEAEEKNWEMLQEVNARVFRERVDIFFENYPEEDLLALVEDALIDEEDGVVSREGREPLFITLKTIIDVLAVRA